MSLKLDNNNNNNNNNNTFEGVRVIRYFSPFFITSKNKAKNLIFGNSQNMWIFLAQMNKTCWETLNSREFAMISLL